jgi:hypothetical protein
MPDPEPKPPRPDPKPDEPHLPGPDPDPPGPDIIDPPVKPPMWTQERPLKFLPDVGRERGKHSTTCEWYSSCR